MDEPLLRVLQQCLSSSEHHTCWTLMQCLVRWQCEICRICQLIISCCALWEMLHSGALQRAAWVHPCMTVLSCRGQRAAVPADLRHYLPAQSLPACQPAIWAAPGRGGRYHLQRLMYRWHACGG